MNMLVNSAAVATATALPAIADAKAPPCNSKLKNLIKKWHDERSAMNQECRAIDVAYDATKAELKIPAIIRYSRAAIADGIERPHPDFPKPETIHPTFIKRAIGNIQPQTVTKTQTEKGLELVYLAKPLPLTAAQIARRDRLQERLTAAEDYERAIKVKMQERGFYGVGHDEIVNRHSTAAFRIEKKIAAHKCADATELRIKIGFFQQLPDFEGWFDDMDAVRAIFAEAHEILGRGMR